MCLFASHCGGWIIIKPSPSSSWDYLQISRVLWIGKLLDDRRRREVRSVIISSQLVRGCVFCAKFKSFMTHANGEFNPFPPPRRWSIAISAFVVCIISGLDVIIVAGWARASSSSTTSSLVSVFESVRPREERQQVLLRKCAVNYYCLRNESCSCYLSSPSTWAASKLQVMK